MTKFPVNFPISRGIRPRDRFDTDWDVSHTVLLFWRVGRFCGKVPTIRALARTNSVSGAYTNFHFRGKNVSFIGQPRSGIFQFPFLHPEVDQRLICL
jgi:hypothetical protein